ncbi:MAG: carboxylating nicotinate-nucleotide diphosphorylase [Pseudomonadota bacterium]
MTFDNRPLALPSLLTAPLIDRAFAEDFGDVGDLTTQACIEEDSTLRAQITARRAGTLAGVDLARQVFHTLDPALRVENRLTDGDAASPGETIATIEGPARALLMAERVALNFLGRLSGIATATKALVAQTAGTHTRIVCTRKTTPGLRAVEKFAVRCGGGRNHRFGLYDAVMIKDNHIAANGSIANALAAARHHVGHTVKIEIEVDTLDQLAEVLAQPEGQHADIILLDNMSHAALCDAVKRNQASTPRILEASGNVTVESVAAIAQTGVDYISSGWITHSAPNLDVGLDII